ncbi:unnamed protein product [Lathyrus oleraceus]
MSRILMFVYDMIIFLSLFLLVTSKTTVPCTSDKDCPETILHKIWQCIDNFCVVKMTGSMCPGCY